MKTGPVILVIDDEPPMRRLLEMTLSPHGYRVRFAVNGREGIAMSGTERAELIILDLGLPDVDGLDVLREIRKQSKTPVIILSVRDAEADIVTCLNEGADDYVVKPFRTGELLARMQTALRHNQAHLAVFSQRDQGFFDHLDLLRGDMVVIRLTVVLKRLGVRPNRVHVAPRLGMRLFFMERKASSRVFSPL